jgi:zinc D-Ala-D-Ala carboxypeptidase
MSLSPHFTLAEFCASEIAARNGLDNTIPPELIPNAVALCEHVLEPARAVLGPIRINSGYRSKKVNTAVGGAWGSLHQFGQAADIIPLGRNVRLFDLFEYIYKNLRFDTLIWEYGAWVHVSYTPTPRSNVLVAAKAPGRRRPVYTAIGAEQIAALGL